RVLVEQGTAEEPISLVAHACGQTLAVAPRPATAPGRPPPRGPPLGGASSRLHLLELAMGLGLPV
ncbi:MAG: hypothetical protein AAF170_12065, partial [Bacteroidota bacterium]